MFGKVHCIGEVCGAISQEYLVYAKLKNTVKLLNRAAVRNDLLASESSLSTVFHRLLYPNVYFILNDFCH